MYKYNILKYNSKARQIQAENKAASVFVCACVCVLFVSVSFVSVTIFSETYYVLLGTLLYDPGSGGHNQNKGFEESSTLSHTHRGMFFFKC